MPNVELLTCGGAGVATLAASYTTEAGIPLTPLVPDFSGRTPERAAIEKRDNEFVTLADAAAIVREERGTDIMRLLDLVKAKGIPLHIVGGRKAPRKAKRVVEKKNNPPSAPCLPMG